MLVLHYFTACRFYGFCGALFGGVSILTMAGKVEGRCLMVFSLCKFPTGFRFVAIAVDRYLVIWYETSKYI